MGERERERCPVLTYRTSGRGKECCDTDGGVFQREEPALWAILAAPSMMNYQGTTPFFFFLTVVSVSLCVCAHCERMYE